MEREMILLVMTLENSVEKLIIFPLCILPLSRDTTIQINAKLPKKGLCDGRYDLRLAGFVHIMKRNDIVKITISAISVIVRNLRLSIRPEFYDCLTNLKLT
jgi:hypothetical protein